MTPYFDRDGVTLYHGDCLGIMPTLEGVDAVVSDPPYGMKWNTDTTRFSGGVRTHRGSPGEGRDDWGDIKRDDRFFDPSPWLAFRKVVLFGANHFGSRLPVGTTLVWVKRNDHAYGTFLSDAEIGWMKGGHGVYLFKDLSMNAIANARVHPTQKPIALMRWCIERLKLKPGALILDGYMGSGTTGVAAVQLGHRFVGIELDERYCEIAAKRIEAEMARTALFA